MHGRRILELGSGRQDLGKERYSVRGFFDPSNEFIQSDVDPRFGHAIVDATSMEFRGEFDVILCLNVLEHVYDFQTALDRIHLALRPGGMMILQVPAFFPLHDEPHDFWRFTEHALRQMLARFDRVELKRRGSRRIPFSYLAIAAKEPAADASAPLERSEPEDEGRDERVERSEQPSRRLQEQMGDGGGALDSEHDLHGLPRVLREPEPGSPEQLRGLGEAEREAVIDSGLPRQADVRGSPSLRDPRQKGHVEMGLDGSPSVGEGHVRASIVRQDSPHLLEVAQLLVPVSHVLDDQVRDGDVE